MDFLENPDQSCAYSLRLSYPFGTSKLKGNDVDRSHLGYTFIYHVYAGFNSCWGYVTIEDKAPAQPFCRNDTISCFQLARLNELLNTMVDNCSQDGRSIIERLDWSDYGCDSVLAVGRVIRLIRSFDKWGNTSTCHDTITVRKDSFPLIKCPDMVNLGCRVLCKKPGNTGSSSNPANFDVLSLSPVVTSPYYPTPELLLTLQERDTFKNGLKKCISPSLKVVPYIKDSVFSLINDAYVLTDTCVRMYPSGGQYCKLIFNYNDLVFPICGTGFKIRREWRFTDWCKGKDTICVQYINVEDKQAPLVTSKFTLPFIFDGQGIDVEIPGYRVDITTNAHDCNGRFCLDSLSVDDCNRVKQNYNLTYIDPKNLGTSIVRHGNPKDCFTLPADLKAYYFTDIIGPNASFALLTLRDFTLPRGCYPFIIQAQDECFNTANSPVRLINQAADTTLFEFNAGFAGIALICITDQSPPIPVCDELTQTTIDPDQCWSRIYAEELDNGSKDNCCDILHFAVAHMDSVNYYRAKYSKQMEDSCGKAAYWKDKAAYDEIIEAWINCYVFKDYIDLTNCAENMIVLRVYEACGVPKYDPHVYPCSPHSWFCYNSYPSFMLWHNYQLDVKPASKCETALPWLCLEKHQAWIEGLVTHPNKDYWLPAYTGATFLILSKSLPIIPLFCWPEFAYKLGAATSGAPAPGKTCSRRLYSDCMIRILVDDKTPPVAQKPADIFWYCDNVSSVESDQYEYAICTDFNWILDNAQDLVCQDQYRIPYHAIESTVENDNDLSDTADATGKNYGWYGCNIYGSSHPDEHGEILPCNPQENSWSPVYCHSWLRLDKNDAAGKVDPKTAFASPVLRNGNPGSDTAGTGKFWIWDNCWIDTTSFTIKDEFYFDKCNNGWIKRSWNVKDRCGNAVTVDQKIVTKHRSDFEVMFPEDKVTVCDNKEDVSPEAIGKPIVMDDECELVGVNYEDQRFDIVPDACYKIVRTWRIVDWCKFDPGLTSRGQDVIVDDRVVADTVKRPCVYRHLKDNGDGFITYIQIIVIKDTIAPVITCLDDTVCIFSENCELPTVSIPFSATDNCTSADRISYRWELNENPSASDLLARAYNKSSIDKKSSASVASLSIVQPQGKSLVTVIAEDNCGNEDTCTFILTVRDCKRPTPYCYHGIATVIMPSTGTIKVWAKDLDAGSFDNCTSQGNLKFSFGPSIADSCKIFDCTGIPNGVSFTIEIDIYVWDEAGNFDYCSTFINIQDGNGDVCEDAKSVAGSISGEIRTPASQPIEHVLIEAQSSHHLPSFKTTFNGQYAFLNLPLNAPYLIKPSRNDQPSNGVSTIDLLMIQKHILGMEPFQNGYQYLAADVNNDKAVTALDMLELRKLILYLYDELSGTKSWKFVPKQLEINTQNPWIVQEYIDIKGLKADELKKDFVGIKIGDLNHSVIAHRLAGLENRSIDHSLTFSTEDRLLVAGQETIVSFSSPNFLSMEAFQFSLKHEGLEILDVQGHALELDQRNFGVINGYLTTSWTQPSALTVTDQQTLLSIKVKATKTVKLSQSLAINSMYTRAESFNGKEAGGVNLVFDNQSNKTRHNFTLYQNIPNPFQTYTLISFDLPQNESVTIQVTDLTGRVLINRKIYGVQGYNQYRLEKQELNHAGVYYYSIETNSARHTRRMIMVD